MPHIKTRGLIVLTLNVIIKIHQITNNCTEI